MNYRVISRFLGRVAVFLGICMLLCVPWGWRAFVGVEENPETRGVVGLELGAATCFLIGFFLIRRGRGANLERVFRKEAIASVVLSWFLAVILGATPYLYSGSARAPGVPMSVADALFESSSGLTTTGATVFSELENPESLPRTILFWRSMTHLVGGLGVMCFFVAFLGQGARGKALLKLEHNLSGVVPIGKARPLAFTLMGIFLGLVALCALTFLCCGMTFYDAISHAFSTIALGGFSTHNDSIRYFITAPDVNNVGIGCAAILFMVVSGTNYWLLYWVALGKPSKLFRDTEWRCYILWLVIGAAIVFAFGLAKGDYNQINLASTTLVYVEKVEDATEEKYYAFEEFVLREKTKTKIDEGAEQLNDVEELSWRQRVNLWDDAAHRSVFHVVSLATGAGFVAERYESWNATSLTIILIMMVIGGCGGSAAGGIKIFRVVYAWKALANSIERLYNPNVVRATRLDGEIVKRETLDKAIVYIALFLVLINATATLVISVEPDALWTAKGADQADKAYELTAGTLAMYANVGPAFGALGSFDNYGVLTDFTKIVFAFASLLGRLEIWIVLAIFTPGFWKRN